MEDILSSIRKVIAEDLSQKEAAENKTELSADTANTIAPIEADRADMGGVPVEEHHAQAEAAFDDILDLNDLLGDKNEAGDTVGEVMELIQLDDATETGEGEGAETKTETVSTPELEIEQEPEQEFEALTIPSSPDLPDADTNTETDTNPATEAPVVESLGDESLGDESPVVESSGDDMDFDETLDLVMDSDASDYVTERLTPVTDAPHAETAEASKDHKSSLEYDGPMVKIVDNILFSGQKGVNVEASTSTAKSETPLVPETIQDPKPAPETEQASTNKASAEDDMDLVKSLLEDLMDEPVSETVAATVEATVAETALNTVDDFSEDDFLIPDPETLQSEPLQSEIGQSETGEEPTQDSIEEAAEDVFETLAGEAPTSSEAEPENEIETELAQIAREIAEAREIAPETTPDNDDVVELSTPDFASKLAVSASLASGAALDEDKAKGILAVAAEKDLESLQQLLADTDLEDKAPETPDTPDETLGEIPDEIEMLISPIQEEETMAKPVKSDVLSDADTQQEVGNAFASLTTTVQEHALAEENGPPIGELVKEALRPMLQEWLDKNLKSMVQRAVTKEIKRISSSK